MCHKSNNTFNRAKSVIYNTYEMVIISFSIYIFTEISKNIFILLGIIKNCFHPPILVILTKSN